MYKADILNNIRNKLIPTSFTSLARLLNIRKTGQGKSCKANQWSVDHWRTLRLVHTCYSRLTEVEIYNYGILGQSGQWASNILFKN